MITREHVFEKLIGPGAKEYIANNFAKYTKTGELSRFLCRYELYKHIKFVKGSICECGLKSGAGLLQWYHISKLLDPYDLRRLCFGFDTFEGFPPPTIKDGTFPKEGVLADIANIYNELLWCIEAQENQELTVEISGEKGPQGEAKYAKQVSGRLLAVKGDFMQTGPEFIAEYPHLVLALLYLDFDLYEPTKLALELFLPRMPKGAVLVFDELNNAEFPGETVAVMETMGIKNLRLRKFSFNKDVSYVIL